MDINKGSRCAFAILNAHKDQLLIFYLVLKCWCCYFSLQNETNVTVDAKSSDHALVSNIFEEMKSLLKELQWWKWFDNIFISIFKRSINNYNEHNFKLSQMVFLSRDLNFKCQLYFIVYGTKVWEFLKKLLGEKLNKLNQNTVNWKGQLSDLKACIVRSYG